MTVVDDVDRQASVSPAFSVRYTIEELAVLADLLDLESLPGVFPIEMSLELRSLATRCLVARQVVRMPDDGGVEVTQPHATLIAGMLDAELVRQVTRTEGDQVDVWTWFDLDTSSVRVTADDEGIVDIAAFTTPSLAAIESTLGISVVAAPGSAIVPEVLVDMATSIRQGSTTCVERARVARCAGTWHPLEPIGRQQGS